MDFLTEILSTTKGKSNVEIAKKDISLISSRILDCKHETNEYIDNIRQQFIQWPAKNQKLIDNSTKLLNQSHDLHQEIQATVQKELNRKQIEFSTLSEELERSRIASEVITKLIQCHTLLNNIKDLQRQDQLLEAVQEFLHLEETIENIPEDEVTDALKSLKSTIESEKHSLYEAILHEFNEHVQFTQQIKSETIQINTVKFKTGKKLYDVLLMLGLFKNLTLELDKCSKLLWEYICDPIIHNISTIKIEEGDFKVLTVSIKKSSANIAYKDVFSKLIDVFRFIQKNFKHSINEIQTLSYVGNNLQDALTQEIANECINHLIPTNFETNEAFKDVVMDMRAFQNNLVELEILEAQSNPFLDYIGSMDTIFINNKCQEYLNSATKLMKKDLHDMVNVSNLPLTLEDFPESSISRSTVEILELVEKLLQQSLTESELFAARIIYTVQNIFYQYPNTVYSHHERLLQTIPQQVALFRNNCVYISHRLVQLNKTYSAKFSKNVLSTSQVFMDQGHQLSTTGSEMFSNYVENQVKQMEYTLEEGQFTSLKVADKLNEDTNKCLRQCVRQYELLKTVWLKVLPQSVYNKTLGYLFNSFCKRLIEIVIKAQDIPSKNAEQLVEMYKVVLTRGPKLFSDPQEISLHVELWQKLNDLVFILAASLVDIDNRWSEGKGPLTLTFKPEEIRELIKALFQNTDRRAAVLTRIR